MHDNLIMASFNIKSLFTKIPLDETIDIIVTRLFSNSTHFHGFNSDDFTKLLQLSVKNCHFLFNGVLYEQIDGVAMGSPLGPLFADIFLSWHEQNWLELCPSDFKPVLYRRYVDDCFLLFRSNNHINTFLNFLSRQHPNIVFIVENEVNKSLSFLDVKITWDNGSFTTSISLYTNFDSFILFNYKKGLVLSLLNCYFNVCSTYITFHSELDNFKELFSLNGYPRNFLDNRIRRFLDKFSPIPKVSLAPKKIMYFCLPFTGQHSLQIRTQIHKLCSHAFPHISIHFVFRPLLCLAHFFPSKDRIPNGIKYRVVYLFKCQCCNASYVGQTSQLLHTWIADHLGISPYWQRACQPLHNKHSITSPQHWPSHYIRWFHLHLSLMNSSSEKAYSFTNSILPSTLNQAQFLFPYSDCLYPLRHLWHLITSYFLSNAKFMLISYVIIF